MTIEELSEYSLTALAQLFVKMWPECEFDEEYEFCKNILRRKDQTAYLAKEGKNYIGFAYLSLRKDFVEGSESSPVAYLEGIYIQKEFRKKGYAESLVKKGIDWGKINGCDQMGSDAEIENSGSITFHKRTGFKEVNRVVCFIRDI